MSKSEHDPAVCFCGTAVVCGCPCPKCSRFREMDAALARMEDLRGRLAKANIDVGDLADLLWREVEHSLAAKIEKIARDKLRVMLKGLKLTSVVKASSADWAE